MNNRKKLYVSVGIILSIMTLITIFAFRQEAQIKNANIDTQQDDAPIADLNAPESSNPKERDLEQNGVTNIELLLHYKRW